MQLTSDQVLALAPDSGSAANGKKLANPRHWRNLGQSDAAIWGECQGSALYQVRVELATFAVKCSCPSHKFPCKHGLGLLLLATDPGTVPVAEPPEWVSAWLARRSVTVEKKASTPEKKPHDASSAVVQSRRLAKRESLIAQGLDSLDLWMNDLIRNGLAAVQSQSATFWERQAAQMVDAQAPGVAARLRAMSGIPGASPDWPAKLLAELGRLTLLTHAYRRQDDLAPALREDVRQLVGWSLKEDEVGERGETVTDDWLVLGQRVQRHDDRGRTQYTWLLGATTHRPALILQFSYASAPFKETFVPGTRRRANLVFWPGAAPLRARFVDPAGEVAPLESFPGNPTIAAFRDEVAGLLARNPWHERFLCALRDVTPIRDTEAGRWWLRDRDAAALPLAPGDHWKLLAISGGHPLDLAGEWDGESLLPLGTVSDHIFHPLWEAQ